MRRLAILLAAPLALLVLVAVPLRQLAEDENAWAHGGVALALCLVPAVATFVVAEWFMRHDRQQAITVLLGANGARMFAVLVAAVLLMTNAPLFARGRFLVWLVAFYIFTLTLEMTLLLTGRPSPDGQP